METFIDQLNRMYNQVLIKAKEAKHERDESNTIGDYDSYMYWNMETIYLTDCAEALEAAIDNYASMLDHSAKSRADV